MTVINHYIEEYQNSLEGVDTANVNWVKIEKTLVNEHGWTEEGARHLIHLVRDYGRFILSHAIALSIVLNQEDGEIGL